MRTLFCLTASLLFLLCVAGCATVEGNRYNPYVQSQLADSRGTSEEQHSLMRHLGGHATTLQAEAAHREHWKEEVYPVAFGNKKAGNEVLVFLDYAAPESAKVWGEVVKASRGMNSSRSKIVVLCNSGEKYGTELMGGGIWVIRNYPKQGLDYFTVTLGRWNDVKARQKRQGRVIPFVYEYDATASATEGPILYGYLEGLRPPVPDAAMPDVVKNSYDAGNVNLYQAVDAARYYGVKKLPAVVVNEQVLPVITADAILAALR